MEAFRMPTSRVDWAAIHRRLEASSALFEQGATPSAEVRARVLKARARTLAREPEVTAAAQDQIGVVEFLLAHETYALESVFVREVHPLRDLTSLPGTPAFVAGIVNVRGQIVAIIDLRRLFGLPTKGLTDLNKVIVLHNQDKELGLLADAVLGVRRIALQEIQAPLPTLTGIHAEYLRGVTRDRTVILDGVRILLDPRITVREEL
jgi:purine-binding chemotaxis protein CheW